MESVEDKVLNQSVAGFHLQYFGFQNLEAVLCAFLQNIQTGRATHAYRCWQGCGTLQGILGLNRIGLGLPRPGHLLGLAALHRMRQGLYVLHKTLIASAGCAYWLLSATRSGPDHQFHCPYGTPKWVKTRLAASLRQGLMVILSAKSSHA
jgi:hypothetical protein